MAAETDRPSQSDKNVEAHLSGSGIQLIGDENIVLGKSSFYNTGTIGTINHYHSSDIIEGHLIQYLADVQAQYRSFWQQHIAPLEPEANPLPQPVRQLFYADWFHTLEQKESSQAKKTEENLPQVKSYNSLQVVLQRLRDPEISKQFTQKGIVLLGEPGAGKTVALHHIAATTANQIGVHKPQIPIYLPLNQYAGETDLATFIYNSLKKEHLPPSYGQLADHFSQILSSQRWLLLLDGYNEIGESVADKTGHRRAFLRALQQFSRHHRVQFVLSSRENFASDLTAYHTISIRPLSQLGIEHCLQLYAPKSAADILQQIVRQPTLYHLVTNPFRAKAIAQIYAPDAALPTTAVALYRQLVSHLIEREWRRCHANGTPFPPPESWQSSILQVAANLHLQHTTAAERALYLAHEADLTIAAQCGLLQPLTSQVQFIHHQLQEYFAALWVADVIQREGLQSEQLTPIWQDRYWDEAVLLVCTLLPNETLSQLIVLLAEYDPYLAAQAVGQTPERVSPAVRSWLAAYLAKGWQLIHDQETDAIRALGAMRCQEGFAQLQKRADVPDYTIAHYARHYLTAVSQFDHESAARFIAAQLREAVQWDTTRGRDQIEYSLFTVALGEMKTPYARAFLIQALQDRKLSKAALEGIKIGRFHEAIPVLREMLDSEEFEAVCATIGEAQFTALIPDLLPYAEQHPAAMTAVLRMNAGQGIVDAAAYFHHSLTQLYQYQSDIGLFGITNRYQSNLTYLLYLDQVGGQEKTAEYVELILAVARHGNLEERAYAIAVLLFVRHPQLSDIVHNSEEPPPSDNIHLTQAFQQIRSAAQVVLAAGLQPGFANDPILRFIILTSRQKAWPSELNLPEDLTEILQTAAANRQQVGQWVNTFIQQQKSFVSTPVQVIDAMAVLVELGWPDMAYRLTAAVNQCVNAWIPGEDKDGTDYRQLAWRYVSLLLNYAQQNDRQRHQVLQAVAPHVHQYTGLWPQIAIEICVSLEAGHLLSEWLRYLRDSSWQKAYLIVAALGRLDVPTQITNRLVKRLGSHQADERFFAVLALGEIKQTATLPNLLALTKEQDKQVQWALVWAIGRLGITPDAADFLTTAASWHNGRARRELAQAIGNNQYRPLASLLYQLLDDPDLRVVDRAVWALGMLGETAVTNTLSKLLNRAKHRGQMAPYQLKRRVETNLQHTLTVALTRIKHSLHQNMFSFLSNKQKDTMPPASHEVKEAGGRSEGTAPDSVDQPDADGKTQQEKDTATVTENIPEKLSAICRGLILAEQIIDRYETGPLISLDLEAEIEQASQRLEILAEDELARQIYEADFPEVRLKALTLSLAKTPPLNAYELNEYLSTNIRRAYADPSPAVRRLAHHQNPYGNSRTIDLYISPKYLNESLAAAQTRFENNKEITIKVHPLALKEWSGLSLARWFAPEFELAELHDALLKQYPQQQPEDHIFAFLAETVPPEKLPQLALLWRQHSRNPEQRWLAWQTDSSPTLNPLAGRHYWGIVPDLVQLLWGTTNAAEDAAYALIDLGIYQAAAPIEKKLETSTKQMGEEIVSKPVRAYLKTVVQVELRGATSEIVPPHILGQTERYNPEDSVLWDHFGDLLCEVDSLTPPAEWFLVQEQVARDHYGENDRYSVIKRGLRKWGLAALTQFFEQGDSKVNDYNLRYIKSFVFDANEYAPSSFLGTIRQVMHDPQTYPNTIFFTLLEQPQSALRLWGMFTLAARRFPIPIATLHNFLSDPEAALGYALVHCAPQIPTLDAILHTMAEGQLTFKTDAETAVAEKVAGLIIELIEDEDLDILQLLTQYRLPQFDAYILSWITQDDFGDSWDELYLLLHFDTVLAHPATQTKIRRLLTAGNPAVFEHLLQEGQRNFGRFVAPLLLMAEDEEPDPETSSRSSGTAPIL